MLEDPADRGAFLNFAAFFEGGLMFAAFFVGWLVSVNPVQNLTWDWRAVGIGLLGTGPLLAIFAATKGLPFKPFQRIHSILVEGFGPWLSHCRLIDLVLLSLLAGVCEEIVFRGFLQPWISQLTWWTGFLAANIVFGIFHMVTPTYAILAFAIGCYMSGLLLLTPGENLLSAITTHAVYDFLALVFVVREFEQRPQPVTTDGD